MTESYQQVKSPQRITCDDGANNPSLEVASKLKPCPFCGGRAYTDSILRKVQMILCDDCGATCSFYGSETVNKAFKAWNKRVGEQK